MTKSVITSEDWEGFSPWVNSHPYRTEHGKISGALLTTAALGLAMLIRDTKVAMDNEPGVDVEGAPWLTDYSPSPDRLDSLIDYCKMIVADMKDCLKMANLIEAAPPADVHTANESVTKGSAPLTPGHVDDKSVSNAAEK